MSTILSQTITSDIESFVGLIGLLEKDTKIIKIFKEKDRDALFLYLYIRHIVTSTRCIT